MYAEWTGGAWHNEPIVDGGGRIGGIYAPGISLDHENPNVVYLSRKVGGRCVVRALADRRPRRDVASPHGRRRRASGDCAAADHPARPRRPSSTSLWMQGLYRG